MGGRRDKETCSKACRQARHRFRVGVAPADPTGLVLHLAYADPPYPGLARRYYGSNEVNHAELLDRLVTGYPDGWALSTSAAALPEVLRLCPPGVRVAAWVRGARRVKARRALNAWEPLICYGGRVATAAVVQDLQDVLLSAHSARARSHPGALVGMKSAAYLEWLFRLLGACQGDTLDDLFPGSGVVDRAWSLYTSPAAAGRLPSRLAGAARQLTAQLGGGRKLLPRRHQ